MLHTYKSQTYSDKLKTILEGTDNMTTPKQPDPHQGGKKMNSETADFLSHLQEDHQKSKTGLFPVEDKRKAARHIHTNGSTSSDRA